MDTWNPRTQRHHAILFVLALCSNLLNICIFISVSGRHNNPSPLFCPEAHDVVTTAPGIPGVKRLPAFATLQRRRATVNTNITLCSINVECRARKHRAILMALEMNSRSECCSTRPHCIRKIAFSSDYKRFRNTSVIYWGWLQALLIKSDCKHY